MRPTITEQLASIRQILASVVAPELTAKYPSDILAGVIGNLKELEANWVRWVAYVGWENEQLSAILRDTRGRTSAALQSDVDAALGGAAAAGDDYAAACTRNDALRSAAAALVREARTDRDLRPDAEQLLALFKSGLPRRT
jgi:hypothetical protein